jgi:hypothetical protein
MGTVLKRACKGVNARPDNEGAINFETFLKVLQDEYQLPHSSEANGGLSPYIDLMHQLMSIAPDPETRRLANKQNLPRATNVIIHERAHCLVTETLRKKACSSLYIKRKVDMLSLTTHWRYDLCEKGKHKRNIIPILFFSQALK